MKRTILSLLLAAVFCLPFSGCSAAPAASGNSSQLTIVATLFPQYDFARQLAGDKAEIKLLLPPGTESHSFEPKPSDIIAVSQADLFLYTGEYMEPWAQTIIDGVADDDVEVVDVSQGISLVREDDEHESHEGHEAAHQHEYDPHVWTSPVNAMQMVKTIADALCRADPENEAYYRQNESDYLAQLQALDSELREITTNAKRHTVYFGSRFALFYFMQEYGLDYKAAYDSCSEETEPSVRSITEMVDEIRAEGIPVIYYEELTDPKIARVISEETGAKMLLFHSCHNVSRQELEDGVTYLDLMRQNAQNLKEGLN